MTLPAPLTFGLLALACLAAPCPAREVRWRPDYAVARREARETQRPLVLDFGTVNCFWCKKLDASTFRDPAIVRRLNEQFVPVKIDADRNPDLARSLRVERYPTLVFCAPDGRVLGSYEGFVEAARFGLHLDRALRESARPGQAEARSVAPCPAPAAAPPAIVRPGVEIPPPPPPAVPAARSAARPAGLPAAEQHLLAAARQLYRQRRWLSCLEHCQFLMKSHPASAEARAAEQLAAAIRADPAVLAQLREQYLDQLGEVTLAQAEGALRAHDRQQAVACLRRVLEVAPGTAPASKARALLVRLEEATASRAGRTPTIRAQSP